MNNRETSWFDALWGVLANNFGTKIISVVIAVVLWFIVLGSRNIEATKEISLEIITAADIQPANDVPEKIAFRLSGPKAFLRTVLDRRDEPIRVNLSQNRTGLVTYRIFADNIHVPIGVKILSITPTVVPIKLETIKHRDVPVKIELSGTPPDGYKIVRATISPEVVRIRGAESRIDAMTEVSTSPLDVSDIRQNMKREVALDLSRYNVQLESQLPRVSLEVEATQASFRIKNVEVRVNSKLSVKLEDKSVTVLVRASSRDLKSLDRNQVFATVDLSGKDRGEYRETVNVTLPSNVTLVKVIPDKIKVTLY